MHSLSSIIPELKLTYLVVDSEYGNLQYLKLAKEKRLFIFPKLRAAPALFFNYGDEKVAIKNLPSKHRVSMVYFIKYFNINYALRFQIEFDFSKKERIFS